MKRNYLKHVCALLSFSLLALAPTARCEVKPNILFTDNAVLQQGAEVPIWGTARTGESVTVTLAGQTATTVAKDGRWLVKLKPLAAGGPFTLTIQGDNTVTAQNVLVGEVWLCGGQSNMERQLGPRPPQPLIQNWEQEAAVADFPRLRHFGVAHQAAKEPVAEVSGAWAVCSPATVKDFTAVGFFFGRELQKQLKVPVGLLHSSWGGTGVAPWTSRECLEKIPEAKAELEATLSRPKVGSKSPTILFQSMIAPLIPYALKGAIWFQGESGAGVTVAYDKIFPLMIADWRAHWGIGDFPFYFIQLPNGQPLTREAQARALELPHTGMVVGLDVGDKDVHGPIKAPLGERLARLALTQTYGYPGDANSPRLKAATVEGAAMRITFTHAPGGLKANGPLQHFIIAGADQKFVPAEARIEGEAVIVSSPAVPKPVSVRYGWTNVAAGGNLYNQAGLPAAPFRTDSW